MGIYSVVFSNVAVTAQQDLFELVGAADSITILHAVYLSQSTEVGDAQEEGLSIGIRRMNTTTGNGTSFTPNPVENGTTPYGGSAKINGTTKATAGTPFYQHVEMWNIRAPYMYLPTPEMRGILGVSQRLCVELMTTPADSITMSGTLYFEELGG